MSVKKSTVESYYIRNPKFAFSWARVFIEPWKGGGSIAIQSDYGDFSFSWGNIGQMTFKKFLFSLDYDYFMKKARKTSRGYVFCPELTVKYFKQEIARMRHERSISKYEARELWDDVSLFYDCRDEHEAITTYWHSNTLYSIFETDPPFGEIKDPSCVMFWENIWPILISEFEKEGYL
jgi:hypothetical protein